MAARINLGHEDMEKLLGLVAQFGGVEQLAAAVTAPKPRRETVPFRTAQEVLDAVANRVITRPEARRLFGLRNARTTPK